MRGSEISFGISSGRGAEKCFWLQGGIEDDPGEMGRSWTFLRLNLNGKLRMPRIAISDSIGPKLMV